MGRVPAVGNDDADERVKMSYDALERIAGRVPNFSRTAAHSPAILRWLVPFVSVVQRKGPETELEASTRELAILKTSLLNQCSYCYTHNQALGRGTGLSEEQLHAIEHDDHLTSAAFTDRERLAISWAEAVTLNTARRDMALFAALEDEFSSQEIVELTFAIAMFNMINRVNESLHVDLEDQSEVDKIRKSVDLDTDAMRDYVKAVSGNI